MKLIRAACLGIAVVLGCYAVLFAMLAREPEEN